MGTVVSFDIPSPITVQLSNVAAAISSLEMDKPKYDICAERNRRIIRFMFKLYLLYWQTEHQRWQHWQQRSATRPQLDGARIAEPSVSLLTSLSNATAWISPHGVARIDEMSWSIPFYLVGRERGKGRALSPPTRLMKLYVTKVQFVIRYYSIVCN
jgi:hypothetical protein